MSDDEKPTAFEERLKELPRCALPGELREEILANACGEPSESALLIRIWRSTPKLALGSIAAAWVAIGILNFTTPKVEDSAAHVSRPADEEFATPAEEPARLLAAWLEYRRSLEKL